MREFNYPVLFKECSVDLSVFYNPGRRQYDANRILKQVSELSSPNSVKIMGLFSVDLFIPILTYIFGQAILNGNTGIASLYRLRNELYGLEQDTALLIERFLSKTRHYLLNDSERSLFMNLVILLDLFIAKIQSVLCDRVLMSKILIRKKYISAIIVKLN